MTHVVEELWSTPSEDLTLFSSLELQSSAQELCFPMSLDGGRRSQPCYLLLNTLQDPCKGWLCPRAEAGHELCLGWLGTGTQLHLHW